MNRIVKLLVIVGVAAGALLGVRAVLAKYGAIATVALAVWNDPDVKKVRRRALKRLQKAQKSARKALKN